MSDYEETIEEYQERVIKLALLGLDLIEIYGPYHYTTCFARDTSFMDIYQPGQEQISINQAHNVTKPVKGQFKG